MEKKPLISSLTGKQITRKEKRFLDKEWAKIKAKMEPYMDTVPPFQFGTHDFLQQLSPKEVGMLRRATLEVHIKEAPDVPITIKNLDEIISGIGPKTAEQMLKQMIDGKMGSDETRAAILAPMKVKSIQ